MKGKFASVLVGLVLSACGAATSESDVEIVGGSNVGAAQRDPRLFSTVALSNKEKIAKGSSFCSGTLIAPRVVMTAAHCLVDENNKPLDTGEVLVVFGNKVNAKAHTRKALRSIAHPQYRARLAVEPSPQQAPNDIGLVFLDAPAPQGFAPVALASAAAPALQKLRLAGFGVTKSRYLNDTGSLRQVDVTVVDTQRIAQRIITEELGKGACAGDSGGPAYVQMGGRWAVAGVTSSGAEIFGYCIGRNNFTDARQYAAWIRSTGQLVASLTPQ